MDKRWPQHEAEGIKQMKIHLAQDIENYPIKYGDIIGERSLLRFYRGHNNDVEKAVSMFRKNLEWRVINGMDGIRQDILDGRNNPTKFPNADAILNLMPQTICNYKMKDKMDRPITLLRINFSLSQFLNEVRHEDFIEFMKYSAEYQKLVLEQLAEEKERKQKMEFENNPHKYENDHYGVLMQACVVRDLSGISYEQLNSQGFGLLKTLANIIVSGDPTTDSYRQLYSQIPLESLPASLGGILPDNENCDFEFDLSPGGLLLC